MKRHRTARICGALAAVPLCLGLAAPDARADVDPAARLSGHGSASEYWDLTARFEAGDRLFARFLITNAGPGKRNAVAVGHWVTPDERSHRFKNGRRKKRWQLSPDHLALDIGSSHLDLRDGMVRLEVDKKDIAIALLATPDPTASAQPRLASADYHIDVLDSAAPTEGTIWLPGMDAPRRVVGRMAITHTWIERDEAAVALRRIEFISLRSENTIHLLHLQEPGGNTRSWIRLFAEDGLQISTTDLSVEARGGIPGVRRRGYAVPDRLRLSGPHLAGEIRLKKVLLEHDPMGDLPKLLRFLFSSKMQPHRVWANGDFEVTLPPSRNSPSRQFQGSGVLATTFTNPVSTP